MDVADLPPELRVAPATREDVLAARCAVGVLLEPLVGTEVAWVGGFGLRLTLSRPLPWINEYGLWLTRPVAGVNLQVEPCVEGAFPWSSPDRSRPRHPNETAAAVSVLWAISWGATPAERRLRALLCAHQVTAAATTHGRDYSATPAEQLAFEQGQLGWWRSDLAAAVRMLVVSDLPEPAWQVAKTLVPDFPGTSGELVAVALATAAEPDDR